MKKVLYILGEFEDRDIDWLVGFGSRVQLSRGEVLIREGERLDALYIVTEGAFEVTAGAGASLARLGPGEVLGEISYVDARPTTATVTAVEDSVVLAIARDTLSHKLEQDVEFAARFYRAVATFLADRLRDTVVRLGYGPEENLDGEPPAEDELDLDRLDSASRGGVRFERMLRRLQGV
jgi:bacteriocin-type transport-associated protein